jgi:hypothetical protein
MCTTHQDPLGMSTRVLFLDAAVQVVHVELGGPLKPSQKFSESDKSTDFNTLIRCYLDRGSVGPN